jgi:Tfp pilus assembly protein PilX
VREKSHRAEAGSAYIIVLLVLVVLTIFGIALSLITQTEMQVGTNEPMLTAAEGRRGRMPGHSRPDQS